MPFNPDRASRALEEVLQDDTLARWYDAVQAFSLATLSEQSQMDVQIAGINYTAARALIIAPKNVTQESALDLKQLAPQSRFALEMMIERDLIPSFFEGVKPILGIDKTSQTVTLQLGNVYSRLHTRTEGGSGKYDEKTRLMLGALLVASPEIFANAKDGLAVAQEYSGGEAFMSAQGGAKLLGTFGEIHGSLLPVAERSVMRGIVENLVYISPGQA